MNITPEDAKKFPELAALLQHLPFIVARKRKVLAAFRRYAGDGADLALIFGQHPRVRVDVDYFRCEDDGDPQDQGDGSFIQARRMKMGFTPPSPKVGEIYVASDIAMNADDADGALGPVLSCATFSRERIRIKHGTPLFNLMRPYGRGIQIRR